MNDFIITKPTLRPIILKIITRKTYKTLLNHADYPL